MRLAMILAVAGLTISISGSALAESCSGLEARVNQAIASANAAQGICQQARGLAYALRLAAAYNRQCVRGGDAQANEDEGAARQADDTAAASCN